MTYERLAFMAVALALVVTCGALAYFMITMPPPGQDATVPAAVAVPVDPAPAPAPEPAASPTWCDVGRGIVETVAPEAARAVEVAGNCEDAVEWGPQAPVGALGSWEADMLMRARAALRACADSGGFGGGGVLAETLAAVDAEVARRGLR